MLFMLEKLIAEAFWINPGGIPMSVHRGLSTDRCVAERYGVRGRFGAWG